MKEHTEGWLDIRLGVKKVFQQSNLPRICFAIFVPELFFAISDKVLSNLFDNFASKTVK
jgi:hypothetical protein